MKTIIQFITFSLIFAFLGFMSSCNSSSDYELTTAPSGLKYHFFNSDPGAGTGNVGDVYELNMSIANVRDSVFMKQRLMFERNRPVYSGDFHEALSLLHAGDSAVFQLQADSFFMHHGMTLPNAVKTGESILMYLKCAKIMNPIEHMIYKNEEELKRIESFLDRKGWEINTDSTGIKWERMQARSPQGEQVELGDTVEISYFYYTLEERIIQQSKPNDYWKFEVGDGSRISGLSRMLTFMREGEKTRAILPFSQAFGAGGMGALIPPFTTIVLEIEVHKLHKSRE